MYPYSRGLFLVVAATLSLELPLQKATTRRQFGGAIVGFTFSKPAFASLFPLPLPDSYNLTNSYHFMATGETMLSSADVLETNPLFLTNAESGLTEFGREQVLNAAETLRNEAFSPTIIKYPTAYSCQEAASIVSEALFIGRDRVVPEFTFMDGRGAGMFNGMEKCQASDALFALDSIDSLDRPPPNIDGTPNENLQNVQVRLRQVMSVLETQYSGETILMIFADVTTPAVLLASFAGVPLERAGEMEFREGEVRTYVTRESARRAFEEGGDKILFDQRVASGKRKLQELNVQLKENGGTLRTVQEKETEQRLIDERIVVAEKENAAAKDKEKEKKEREKIREGDMYTDRAVSSTQQTERDEQRKKVVAEKKLKAAREKEARDKENMERQERKQAKEKEREQSRNVTNFDWSGDRVGWFAAASGAGLLALGAKGQEPPGENSVGEIGGTAPAKRQESGNVEVKVKEVEEEEVCAKEDVKLGGKEGQELGEVEEEEAKEDECDKQVPISGGKEGQELGEVEEEEAKEDECDKQVPISELNPDNELSIPIISPEKNVSSDEPLAKKEESVVDHEDKDDYDEGDDDGYEAFLKTVKEQMNE